MSSHPKSMPSEPVADYQYPVSECRAGNRENLETFRGKRQEWLLWMDGSAPHSIWPQIRQMLWDDVLFRTINDLREEATARPTPSVGFNGPALRLFQAGFLATQVMAIRRLTDDRKDVLSLRRLIKEIEKRRKIMTREVYVSHDGLPYDFESVRLAGHVAHGPGYRCVPPTGPDAWIAASDTHEVFDRLSGIQPRDRSRDDLIRPEWFVRLGDQIKPCDSVRTFANKFIAHAADPVSRGGLSSEETNITLERLRQAQKAIYQVASFICGQLLQGARHSATDIPLFDPLEHLEKSWHLPDQRDLAGDFWNQHFKAVESLAGESCWPEATSTLDV